MLSYQHFLFAIFQCTLLVDTLLAYSSSSLNNALTFFNVVVSVCLWRSSMLYSLNCTGAKLLEVSLLSYVSSIIQCLVTLEAIS